MNLKDEEHAFSLLIENGMKLMTLILLDSQMQIAFALYSPVEIIKDTQRSPTMSQTSLALCLHFFQC